MECAVWPMVNLDTHVVIFYVTGVSTPRERNLIESSQCVISDMVLWELAMLTEAGRIETDIGCVEFQSALASLKVIPISLEIARMSTRLDFSSDPADEIIAATSIVERIPLLTRDRRILKSRMVPFAV
ncbi:MAG: type II toxin-antitoxin system VapC family toxin [Terriglobia bacterium]